MMTRGSLWLPLAILVLLAGLSFWIERSVNFSASGQASTRTDPEGIMENFDALRTDETGRPHYRLSARTLKHYSNSKLTELESPRFALLDAQASDVRVDAQQATVSADGNEVDLQGDVKVVRAGQGTQSDLTMNTARLLVYPDRDLLRAPGSVLINDATLNLRAGAMEYNARQRVIKLTGRVKARYISGRK